MRRIIPIILAMFMAGSPVLAQDQDNDQYIVFSAMYSSALDSDYSAGTVTAELGMKGGGGFLLAYGHRISDSFAIETEYSTRGSKAESIALNEDLVVLGTTIGAGTYGISPPIKITTAALMANGVYRMGEVGFGMHPYFGVGVGMANVKVHDYTLSDGSSTQTINGGTAGAMAWQIIGGAEIPISDNTSARIGYRYFSTGNLDVGGTKLKSKSHNLELGIVYAF